MPLTSDDLHAIQQRYYAYCYAIDDGDSRAFAACFTDDGMLEVRGGDPIVGTEALTGFADAVAANARGMRHQVTNVLVDGAGDEADGRAYLTVYRAGASGTDVTLTGRYQDSLRRVEGDWRFVVRKMVADSQG